MAILTSRDIGATERQLADVLERTVDGMDDVEVQVLAPPAGTGFSGDTVPFDATSTNAGRRMTTPLVARITPTGYSLYQDHDLETQWRVIDALWQHTDVPVPRIVAHDTTTSSPLGSPFFVMERIEGRAPADAPPYSVRGWLRDATSEQQRDLYCRGLDVLARIHATDWRALGLSFLQDSTANPVGLQRQMDHDERFRQWVTAGRRFPMLEAAADWLTRHLPEDGELALSWGDARLGNMLFDDFHPVAVLDWEMVTLAAPAADLGWWLVFNLIHTVGIARPDLPGFPDDGEAVEIYERCSGTRITDLLFYEVRAAVRAALLLLKYTDALVERGVLQPDAPRQPHTTALNVLEHLLG